MRTNHWLARLISRLPGAILAVVLAGIFSGYMAPAAYAAPAAQGPQTGQQEEDVVVAVQQKTFISTDGTNFVDIEETNKPGAPSIQAAQVVKSIVYRLQIYKSRRVDVKVFAQGLDGSERFVANLTSTKGHAGNFDKALENGENTIWKTEPFWYSLSGEPEREDSVTMTGTIAGVAIPETSAKATNLSPTFAGLQTLQDDPATDKKECLAINGHYDPVGFNSINGGPEIHASLTQDDWLWDISANVPTDKPTLDSVAFNAWERWDEATNTKSGLRADYTWRNVPNPCYVPPAADGSAIGACVTGITLAAYKGETTIDVVIKDDSMSAAITKQLKLPAGDQATSKTYSFEEILGHAPVGQVVYSFTGAFVSTDGGINKPISSNGNQTCGGSLPNPATGGASSNCSTGISIWAQRGTTIIRITARDSMTQQPVVKDFSQIGGDTIITKTVSFDELFGRAPVGQIVYSYMGGFQSTDSTIKLPFSSNGDLTCGEALPADGDVVGACTTGLTLSAKNGTTSVTVLIKDETLAQPLSKPLTLPGDNNGASKTYSFAELLGHEPVGQIIYSYSGNFVSTDGSFTKPISSGGDQTCGTPTPRPSDGNITGGCIAGYTLTVKNGRITGTFTVKDESGTKSLEVDESAGDTQLTKTYSFADILGRPVKGQVTYSWIGTFVSSTDGTTKPLTSGGERSCGEGGGGCPNGGTPDKNGLCWPDDQVSGKPEPFCTYTKTDFVYTNADEGYYSLAIVVEGQKQVILNMVGADDHTGVNPYLKNGYVYIPHQWTYKYWDSNGEHAGTALGTEIYVIAHYTVHPDGVPGVTREKTAEVTVPAVTPEILAKLGCGGTEGQIVCSDYTLYKDWVSAPYGLPESELDNWVQNTFGPGADPIIRYYDASGQAGAQDDPHLNYAGYERIKLTQEQIDAREREKKGIAIRVTFTGKVSVPEGTSKVMLEGGFAGGYELDPYQVTLVACAQPRVLLIQKCAGRDGAGNIILTDPMTPDAARDYIEPDSCKEPEAKVEKICAYLDAGGHEVWVPKSELIALLRQRGMDAPNCGAGDGALAIVTIISVPSSTGEGWYIWPALLILTGLLLRKRPSREQTTVDA